MSIISDNMWIGYLYLFYPIGRGGDRFLETILL